MATNPNLRLVQGELLPVSNPPLSGETLDPNFLDRLLEFGLLHGDAQVQLAKLPRESIDLFFTSPPYADARAYSRIHPDRYVEWFLPFARGMFDAAKPCGSLVINIKNRVANSGPLKVGRSR